jgi:peptidoglycan lytic transglycosylase D
MKQITFSLFFLLIVFFSCGDSTRLESDTNKNSSNEYLRQLSHYELPEKLDFCGEEVPLEIEEVRERAEREFYLLLQKPGQIILYLKRSGRLFPMYDSLLKLNDAPSDIKYLSVAESALYMSRSSKGAMGLWQFMKRTGKSMGLKVNDYVDERRHPAKSTDAGIKYLQQGYDRHKSWILAAAGYNMGSGRVASNLSYQSADDFFDLFLNEETSRYILRIVIIKELMMNSEKYGFDFDQDDLYKPYETTNVVVKGSVSDISAWAQAHGTTYKYIKILNPWILKRKLPYPGKNKSYEIAIPIQK